MIPAWLLFGLVQCSCTFSGGTSPGGTGFPASRGLGGLDTLSNILNLATLESAMNHKLLGDLQTQSAILYDVPSRLLTEANLSAL